MIVTRRSHEKVHEMLKRIYPDWRIKLIGRNKDEFVSIYNLDRKFRGKQKEEISIKVKQIFDYKFKIIEMQ